MELQEKADQLRDEAAKKKKQEGEDDTKNRLKKAVSRRDKAINAIRDFKEKHGDPSEAEMGNHFLKEEAKTDLNLNEFQEKENDKNV